MILSPVKVQTSFLTTHLLPISNSENPNNSQQRRPAREPAREPFDPSEQMGSKSCSDSDVGLLVVMLTWS